VEFFSRQVIPGKLWKSADSELFPVVQIIKKFPVAENKKQLNHVALILPPLYGLQGPIRRGAHRAPQRKRGAQTEPVLDEVLSRETAFCNQKWKQKDARQSTQLLLYHMPARGSVLF